MDASSLAFPFRRVAVTGVGLVTPLGLTRNATWEGIVAGRQAVNWIDPDFLGFPTTASRSRPFGAAVPWQGPLTDRMVAFAQRAADEAIQQANCTPELLGEAACIIGTSKIDLRQFDHWAREQPENASSELLFPSHAASVVAREWGCAGGVSAPVAACATGLVSVIQAASLIRSGQCSIAIAGGTDASLHPGLLASYRRLGVLADPRDNPALACRPFDATRTGFAVGEGAGILILEDWDHALQRNAPILAEWVDGIIGSEPAGLTRIEPHGDVLAELLRRLLHRTGNSADSIQGISLHATATELNDQAEGAAIEQVFQSRPQPVPAFGIKGAIGHLMGAAGAVETALCVLSLQHQQFPPTVNHHQPTDNSHSSYTITHPGHPSPSNTIEVILKISMGFGGTIAAGVLKRAT